MQDVRRKEWLPKYNHFVDVEKILNSHLDFLNAHKSCHPVQYDLIPEDFLFQEN